VKIQRFSKEVEEIISATRKVAERYGNNYISTDHFLLCFDRYNQNGRLPIRIGFTDKKDRINHIIGDKVEGVDGDNFPLTKKMEEGLKSSVFHCRVMGDSLIMPEHIYLGIVAADAANKDVYLDLLNQGSIQLSKVKLFFIDVYFNQFCRTVGIVRLLY
jgi:ATP-dependent Clp protease ATP-binding subunit ClpA